jgi:hypothetical protein
MMTCLQTLWHGWKTAGLTTTSAIVLGIDHKTASYAKLIKWWSENSTNTAIYIETSYKVNTDSDKNGIFQVKFLIRLTLTRTYKTLEEMLLSAKSFINRNKAVTDLLCKINTNPALPMLFLIREEQTSKCQGFYYYN